MNDTTDDSDSDIPELELTGAVRGKYLAQYRAGTNAVLLEPDLAHIRDPETVNQVLREYLALHGAPPARRRRD